MKCKFKYSNGMYCDDPCEIKSLSQETIIQKIRDKNENLISLNCYHSIESYHNFCYYHKKLLDGKCMPVKGDKIPKDTMLKIIKANEREEEKIIKKKMKQNKEMENF